MSDSADQSPALIFGLTHHQICIWVCRALALFLLQGIALLALYSIKGLNTNPDDMPPGFGLDPIHSVVHLVWGAVATYIGFFQARWSTRFVQVFSVFYTLLAVIGTFTSLRFGMQLELEENTFHWTVGLLTLAIAYGPLLLPRRSAA